MKSILFFNSFFLSLCFILFCSFYGQNNKTNFTGKFYFNGMHNGSFIEFKKDGVVYSGNEYKGMANCLTEGKFTVKEKRLIISNLFNANCSAIENRNGVYQILNSNSIQQEGSSFKWFK